MSEPSSSEPQLLPDGTRAPSENKAQTRSAPVGRFGLVREAWQLVLAGVVGLPLAGLLTLTAVLHSERGSAWLLSGLPGLQVTAPQGALLGPAFSAERVSYRWDQGRRGVDIEGLRWTGAQWRWWLGAGIWAGVQAEELQARRVVVQTGPATGRPLALPTTLALPIEARIQQLRIERLEVDRLPAWRDIRAQVELGAAQGMTHRAEQLEFLWDDLRAQGQAAIGTARPFAVAGQLGLQGTGAVAWEATVSGSGPLQALDLQARLRAPALASGVQPSLEGTVQFKPFEAWPLGTLNLTMQALDLAHLSQRLPSTRLTGRAAVQSQGREQPVKADIVLDNASAGPWNDGRLPVRRAHLDLSSRPEALGNVDIRRLDLDLGSGQRSAGLWRSSGTWSGPALQITGTATDIRPHLLDARAPVMSLSGPLQLGLLGPSLPTRNSPATPVPRSASAARDSTRQAHTGLPWALELQGTLNGALEELGQRMTLTLDGVVSPQEIRLRTLEAQAGAARAALSATFTRAIAGTAAAEANVSAWQVRSSGRIVEFDPAPWLPGEAWATWRKGPHRLNGQWTLDMLMPPWHSGASALQWLQTLQGSAEVDLGPSRLSGVAASGRLRLEQNPGAVAAERSQLQAELKLGRNQLSLSGRGDPAGGGETDRWQLQVSASALGELGPLSALAPDWARWMPQAGRVDARIAAAGRWPVLGTEGQLVIDDLKSPEYTLGRGEARWQWMGRASDPIELSGQLRDAALGPNRLARLRGELRGTLSQHTASMEAALPLRPPEVLERMLEIPKGAGTQARLSIDGGWAAEPAGGGRWAGTVKRLEAGVWSGATEANLSLLAPALTAPETSPRAAPRPPPGPAAEERAWLDAGDVRSELRFDAAGRLRSLRLEAGQAALAAGMRLKWDEARYDLSDPSRADRPDFQWQADVLPFALVPWLQRAQTGLQWTGDLRLSARMRVRAAERLEAEVSLKRHDGDLQVVEAGQVQALGISTVDLTLSAKDGLWSFMPRFVGRSVGEVSGAVQLRTDPQARWPDAQAGLTGTVQARVPNLGVWSGWTPPGWRIQGEVLTTASLGGSFGAPKLTGELTAQGVGVRNLLQGVDYNDGELKVALQGDTARIERLSLRSGDGRLTAQGAGEFGAKPAARLQVRAEGFRVLGRFDRQLVASGQAVLALQPDQLKLDGRVVIDSGLFDLASRDAPTLDDDVKVRSPRDTSSTGPRPEPSMGPGTVRHANVSLDIDLGQKLRLRGRGLDTALQGELKLTTPGGRLAVNGLVRTQGGTYAAYGQKLDIERGILAFTGRVDTPQLDILALRPNTDIRVGVAVRGTPQAPRVRLFSEPELGDTDKLSWLLLGRGSEGLARTDTTVLQRAAVALLAGEGEAPTDSLLRAFGIDDLSVRQADGEGRDTVIRLGKQLSRNWYAGYERGVNATAGTFQLIYRVAQRFTLRAQSGLENSLDLIWTWRFDKSPLTGTQRAPP